MREAYLLPKNRFAFMLNNNNARPVDQAKVLVNHLTHSDLLLLSHFNQILMQRLHQPIAGFGGSVFPLDKLACLVGETWVEARGWRNVEKRPTLVFFFQSSA